MHSTHNQKRAHRPAPGRHPGRGGNRRGSFGAGFRLACPTDALATQSTFVVPSGTTSTWTLKLWWQGTMVGSQSGTTGTLKVAVPVENPCVFQADVSQTTAGGQTSYYSGVRRSFANGTCGVAPPPGSTIAGDIFLCSATGTQTTTEVSLGNLAVTGTSISQGNPLPATAISAGTYTMTATAPTNYNFVGCGGSAIPDSSGLAATDSVVVPSGGQGVGNLLRRRRDSGRHSGRLRSSLLAWFQWAAGPGFQSR